MKKWFWAVLLAAVILAGAWLARQLTFPYRGRAGGVLILIPPGTQGIETARRLKAQGVLQRQLPFLLLYWAGRLRHRTIKSGEYKFSRPQSPLQVYIKLERGRVYPHKVLIPEGSDRLDMARILQLKTGLDPNAFLAATANPAPIRDLDPEAPSLEGYLFPDTYRFARGIPAGKVVAVMVARFREIYNSRLRAATPPGGLHGVITLASLVEKETPDPTERPEIAGVFTRRLKKNMPLQCDPTVIYAILLSHDLMNPFIGPLTHSDLQISSPYNTYLHAGLPPGPICSPGVASILAALHPAPGKALYFVSNNHGGHVFADTLAAHDRNVARYRRELAAQRRAQPQNIHNAKSSH